MKKIRRRGRKILSILLSMTMAAGMMLTGITPGTNKGSIFVNFGRLFENEWNIHKKELRKRRKSIFERN